MKFEYYFSKEKQKEFDIKDLKHIADEIKAFSNIYSVILKRIAERINNEYEKEKNNNEIKTHDYWISKKRNTHDIR